MEPSSAVWPVKQQLWGQAVRRHTLLRAAGCSKFWLLSEKMNTNSLIRWSVTACSVTYDVWCLCLKRWILVAYLCSLGRCDFYRTVILLPSGAFVQGGPILMHELAQQNWWNADTHLWQSELHFSEHVRACLFFLIYFIKFKTKHLTYTHTHKYKLAW